MKSKLIFLPGLLGCALLGHAAMVPPVFSGTWHSANGIHYVNMDSCDADIFSYDDSATGAAQQAADSLLPKPDTAGCSWSDVKFSNQDASLMPEDFPSDSSQWNQTIENPGNPLVQTWSRTCSDNQGNTSQFETVMISPTYICPAGSRFGVDISTNAEGCMTNPNTCDADIVGRALKYPGVSWAGHVGMTEEGWGVLEVLNDATVIHVSDSFDDFRNQNPEYPYWGDVYDLPSLPILTDDEAENILLTGMTQANYSPSYTFSANWQAGGGTSDVTFDPTTQKFQIVRDDKTAVFRCDTFVDYSYLAGAGINIVNPNAPVYLPMNTYAAFTQQRFISTNPNPSQSRQEKTNLILSDSLEGVFSQNDLDTTQADQLVSKLQKDNSISRQVKLERLWNLALAHQAEPVKFGYLVDSLGFMYPMELEEDFMQAYQKNSNVDEKLKLLFAMWQGALVQPNKLLTAQDKQRIQSLQIFLKDQIKVESNPRLLDKLIYTYANFTPGKEADDLINQKLKELRVNSPNLMPEDESFRIKIRHALMTQSSQTEMFVDLLDQNKNNPSFSQALCQVLPEYPQGSLNPNVLEASHDLLSQMKQATPPAGRSALYQKLWVKLHSCG